MVYSYIKRAIDFISSFVGLIVLAPVFVALIILLGIANQGSPFFFQLRPGKDGRLFKIVKFRTMNNKKDKEGKLLDDAKRLTGVGRVIRKLSLDEIPQLINVLFGDMSLIGPRPLLPEYLPLYNAEQRKRHYVRPGITGWAQVNGRNAIGWEQKFELDVWYVNNLSFLLDVRIIALTIKKIFKREGISAAGEATMSRFLGTKEV